MLALSRKEGQLSFSHALRAGSSAPTHRCPQSQLHCAAQSKCGAHFPKCRSLQGAEPDLPTRMPSGLAHCASAIRVSSAGLSRRNAEATLLNATTREGQRQLTHSHAPGASSPTPLPPGPAPLCCLGEAQDPQKAFNLFILMSIF